MAQGSAMPEGKSVAIIGRQNNVKGLELLPDIIKECAKLVSDVHFFIIGRFEAPESKTKF